MEGHEHNEGYPISRKTDGGAGASLLQGNAEGAGPVQPTEQTTQWAPHQCLSVSEGRVARGWSQALLRVPSNKTKGNRQKLLHRKYMIYSPVCKNFTVQVTVY